MYNGRHCTVKDYYRIKEKCDAFLNILQNRNRDYLSLGITLSKEIRQYDENLGNRFENNLRRDLSLDELYLKEKELIKELLQNIVVDIREHSEKF